LSKNIFKKEKQSILPYILIGAVLIVALICVTVIGKSKQPKEPEKYERFDITSDMTTIPEGDPYTAEPEPEPDPEADPEIYDYGITKDNIGDYTESVIDGSDLLYLLATMDDTYAYLISSESINRLESVVVGDYVTTSYVENNGMYTSRLTKDSVTGEMHDEVFLNVGRTIDGITSIRWDEGSRSYYSSGVLRIADLAKIIYDPVTDQKYKDVFVKMFVPWDYRGAFKDDDQFYVRKLLSSKDGSLMGYVFEQTTIQFIEENSSESDITGDNNEGSEESND
jgi:hypothetical protein